MNKNLNMLCYNNNNQSYSNLHYSYYNPNSSLNNNYNKLKRQRFKNSYADIAKEKRDFISFEISQKEIEKYKSLPTTAKTKSSINNSQFVQCPKNLKNFKSYFQCPNKTYETIKKNEPSTSLLRSQSTIINNNKQIENYLDKNRSLLINQKYYNNRSKQNKINKRKINILGSYKIENKSKKLIEEDDIVLSSSTRPLENFITKKDNSIFLFKENNNEKKLEINNNNELIKKQNIINNDENQNTNNIEKININNSNSKKIENNKEIVNNDKSENNNFISSDNSFFNIKNKNIKRKIDFEESKNIEPEKKNNNNIYNKIKKINCSLDNDLTLIKPKKKNFKINNVKKRLLKKNISCPSFQPKYNKAKNKDIISNEFQFDENSLLKENIKKILKSNRNTKKFKLNKKNEYNDNKLKELLSKIPKHTDKKEFNKCPGFIKIIKEKNINIIEQYGIKNISKNIMPPNNLEDILFKQEIDFFNNY